MVSTLLMIRVVRVIGRGSYGKICNMHMYIYIHNVREGCGHLSEACCVNAIDGSRRSTWAGATGLGQEAWFSDRSPEMSYSEGQRFGLGLHCLRRCRVRDKLRAGVEHAKAGGEVAEHLQSCMRVRVRGCSLQSGITVRVMLASDWQTKLLSFQMSNDS